MALQNRMARELKSLKRQPPEGVCVWPEEGGGGSRGAGAVRLAAQLQGPPGTPYEGGVFRVAIDVPDRCAPAAAAMHVALAAACCAAAVAELV